MNQVEGEYPDNQAYRSISYFFLNADQGFNYNTWSAPIHWEGMVNSIEVKFTQIRDSGSSKSDYDWSEFPQELDEAIPYIVRAIDRAMRVMD